MSNDTTVAPGGDDIVSVARPFRLQYEEAQSAWVLLYPEGMVKLNQSAGEILKRCDGQRTINAVIAQLETDFEQPGLGPDVMGFLAIAREQRWISVLAADAQNTADNGPQHTDGEGSDPAVRSS